VSSDGKLPQTAGDRLTTAISVVVVEEASEKHLFPGLEDHMYDTTAESNHVLALIKLICRSYCKIRFHSLARKVTDTMVGAKVRKQLSKLILFKHQ